MKDHPYSDPNNWPIDKRGIAAVRTYFEALALMHRCRALEIELRNRPSVSARDVVRSAAAAAFAPDRRL
jgi:hypothetical protein